MCQFNGGSTVDMGTFAVLTLDSSCWNLVDRFPKNHFFGIILLYGCESGSAHNNGISIAIRLWTPGCQSYEELKPRIPPGTRRRSLGMLSAVDLHYQSLPMKISNLKNGRSLKRRYFFESFEYYHHDRFRILGCMFLPAGMYQILHVYILYFSRTHTHTYIYIEIWYIHTNISHLYVYMIRCIR